MNNIDFFETMAQPKGLQNFIPIIIFVIIILFLISLIVGFLYSMKNTSISINDNEIIIKTFLYGRKILITDVLANEIKTIDLNQNSEYKISVRINGISLPNFHLGWMRLKNGEKALVFLTNREKVLLLPTKNYLVLFSMERTEEFINALKSK